MPLLSIHHSLINALNELPRVDSLLSFVILIKRPHVIFMPYPAQSHIKAMLKLAQILHHKGLWITFVNTESNHKLFLESGGPQFLDGSPGFQFITIPENDKTLLWNSVETSFLPSFIAMVTQLSTSPTCIISDGFMSVFTIDAARKLGIPIMLYWRLAVCGFMGFYQIQSLVEKGIIPLKDTSCSTLETTVDWIPGMKGIRVKDFPSFVQTTNIQKHLKFCMEVAQNSDKVSHIIIHTFDELEENIVVALSSMFSNFYTVGPLQLLVDQIPKVQKETEQLNLNAYSLWKEEPECLHWLRSKKPNSVIYVNFGTSTIVSREDLLEFGWGLANSNHYFLWIIRSDLVIGETPVLPHELEEHIKDKGFIESWCSQEKVLNHPSVGGFITHDGWGSTIESLSAGVPMICRPFVADQMTDCRYICNEWGVGLEMENNIKREDVEKLVTELMGKGGERFRNKAMGWKEKARITTGPNGSSFLNVEKLVKEITMLSSN